MVNIRKLQFRFVIRSFQIVKLLYQIKKWFEFVNMQSMLSAAYNITLFYKTLP